MIERFLRRLTVRRRIVGGFLVLVLLSALAIPLIVANHSFLVGRLRQVADVEARADRLLLLASTRIESSRVNLMRYVQDYAPSTYEALDDVDQATRLLTEAQGLITLPDQKAAVASVLEAMADYRVLISDVEAAHSEGESPDVSRLLFQAYRLGNDIGQRIEQIVNDSEARVAVANEVVYATAQRRLIFLVAGYVGVLTLALILASLVQRSITRPVAELRGGAEAFRLGHMDTNIPVVGADELSLLAQTFNQMATQLRDLISTLEQRVADRTADLEQHSAYLEASAEVGRAATSILEADQLMRQVVELIRERFGLYYVGLFLVDETAGWAVLRAGTGEAGRAMLARGHRIKVGEGMIGWSIANAQARVALEAGEDAVRLATAELPDTRSEAALPLRSRGRVLGALTVQHIRPGAFDEDTIVVLQTMTDQVAVALDNARLFAESQEALEATRRAYGELGGEAWVEFLRVRPDLGYRSDERGITNAGDIWRPEMERALQEGEVVQGDGTDAEAKRPLAVPIRVRGDVIGVLDTYKPADAGEWTAEEVALLETLAEQLGLALDSARLYQDTQRRAAREQLTREITDRMRRATDVEDIVQTAVDELSRVLGTSRTFVRLGVAPPFQAEASTLRASSEPQPNSPAEVPRGETSQDDRKGEV
jgi:GAF domain-containing protein/HAMP domain-containing protein